MTRRPAVVSADAYRALATEAEMESAVRRLVALRGGRAWHLRRGDAAPELADLPDLVIVVPGLAALVELKGQRTRLTAGQREVAALLATADRFVGGIVRPVPGEGDVSFDDLLRTLGG